MTGVATLLADVDCRTAAGLAEGLIGLAEHGLGFRGQSDITFELTSSLRRRMRHIEAADRRRLEQQIIAQFCLAAGDQLSDSSTNGDIMALMQHHGAPTRLIDFSFSPFVALYFVAESLSSSDARLFVVDPRRVQAKWLAEIRRGGRDGADFEVLPDHQSFRRGQEHNLRIQLDGPTHLPMVLHPAAASLRMRSQSGFFLVESLVEPWEEELAKAGLLGFIDVNAELKHDLLRVALQTNNGGATLFPGLDGVGREIVERFLVGASGALPGLGASD